MSGRVICAVCRHPRPLHSNGTSGCKARGCHAGPDGTPCVAFVPEAAKDPDPQPTSVLKPVFRSAEPPLAAASGQ
jgi:hypothetical protein